MKPQEMGDEAKSADKSAKKKEESFKQELPLSRKMSKKNHEMGDYEEQKKDPESGREYSPCLDCKRRCVQQQLSEALKNHKLISETQRAAIQKMYDPPKKPRKMADDFIDFRPIPKATRQEIIKIIDKICKKLYKMIAKTEEWIEEDNRMTMPPMILMPPCLKWERPVICSMLRSTRAPNLSRKAVRKVIKGHEYYGPTI